MKVRRTLALLGPLLAVGSLALPWYLYASDRVIGWDTLTGMNWLVSALALAVIACAVRGSSALARRACVAGGSALAVIGFTCLVANWDHTVPGDATDMRRGLGPFVAAAAG